MREFVINDPFRSVGESIRDKDMAAVRGRVPNMPPEKNQLTMDALGSQSRGEGDCIIHALTILSLAFKYRITGNLVVQRSAERENAQHETGKNAGERYKNALGHGVFVEVLAAFIAPLSTGEFMLWANNFESRL
jgi:hypothetical protein